MTKYGVPACFFFVLLHTIFHVGVGVRIPEVYQILNNTGTIKSPNFPNKYPFYITKIWNITAPSGKIIKLNFTSFHLAPNKICDGDFVRIQDGGLPSSDVIVLLCGQLTPEKVIFSTGPQLLLHFETDILFSFPGFQVSYEAVALDQTMTYEIQRRRLVCQGNATECNCFVIENEGRFDHVNCSGRQLVSLPDGLSNISVLLDLSNNHFTKTESTQFRGLGSLVFLTLANNQIEHIANGSFKTMPKLDHLDLSKNRLEHIQGGMFTGIDYLTHLNLAENSIETIDDSSFQELTLLLDLHLTGNQIISISEKLLQPCFLLYTLHLSRNQLKHIHTGALKNAEFLFYLYLSHNQLTEIPTEAVSGKTYLRRLILSNNKIVEVPSRPWKGLHSLLTFLDLSNNQINTIHPEGFRDLYKVVILTLDNNHITSLPRGTLFFMFSLDYLDLSRNNISVIESHYFRYLFRLSFLNLAYNPVKFIEEDAFVRTPDLNYLNLINNSLAVLSPVLLLGPGNLLVELAPAKEVVRYELVFPVFLNDLVSSSGYQCKSEDERNISSCVPCALGTYNGPQDDCLECPAGGLYQDEMAYSGELAYGMGCKLCPHGHFVPPEAAPGKALIECVLCPTGTNYEELAGFKGCECLQNFYRLNRFGPCTGCPLKGLACHNESVSLMPGFYWKWASNNSLASYQDFSEDLLTLNQSYKQAEFKGALPNVYACPAAEEACLGGVESTCQPGYQGPLCAVCSEGYYQLLNNCRTCPEIPWFIVQVGGVVIVIFLLSVSVVVGKKRKTAAGRTVTDMILARLKIVIGFYQVTSGTLNTFSYVAWPGALLTVARYANIIQLNLLDILPLHCFVDTFHVNAYTRLLFALGLNVAIVMLGVFAYHARKLALISNKSLTAAKLEKSLFSAKTQTYRVVCLLIFVTYPSSCTVVLNLLPQTCQQICSNAEDDSCQYFLRSDYSVQCFTDKHKKFLILDYFLLVLIMAVPFVFLFLLWKYHHKKVGCEADPPNYKRKEISLGLSFLYENYARECWFWEIVELLRKVCITSTLTLMGAETRGHLGAAAITSGVYSILVAYFKPVKDVFEHWLHLLSLLANYATMNVGMLLKIPIEETSSVSGNSDSSYVTVVLVAVNVAVIAIMAVNYISSLATAIKSLRKEPQCSVECCVTFMVLVNGAGEEATGVTTGGIHNSVMSRGSL